MQTLESLRKKSQSAEDLYTIVKTVKTLAAMNIRHYEKAVESVSVYYRTVELGLQVVLQRGPVEILERPPVKNKGACVVVFGSDQGLCGGFNDQIVTHALEDMYEHEITHERRFVLCVGSRARSLLEEQGHPVVETIPVPVSLSAITETGHRIVTTINEWESKGHINKVILFYNKLLSSVSYKPQTIHLLPLDHTWFQTLARKEWTSRTIPTFTMDRNRLFSALVHQYIFVSLYRAFLESMASENASRLLSMQTAERNIEERTEALHALYRHLHQNSTTSELLDIVSGFEALQSSHEGVNKQNPSYLESAFGKA